MRIIKNKEYLQNHKLLFKKFRTTKESRKSVNFEKSKDSEKYSNIQYEESKIQKILGNRKNPHTQN